ncbi:hypothetical protein [Burkholderia territorii]|uniref:hypothetical protein n=1 Tax=Burkholderia territorii TaxID=1503055 RepID=UPI0012D85E59|nr:hypothetical protein [Burkholderia territorii]
MARVGFAVYKDRFNRQLHQDVQFDERALAKRLAETSNGRYTQAQIEDQMRIMGVSTFANGHESGAPDTLIGQVPTDSGAKWVYAGSTAEDKPILTQVTAQTNAGLQQYIIANANRAAVDQLPSQFNYDRPSSNGSGFNMTGPFTKFDQSDLSYVRRTTAETASMVSTNAGRFGSVTTAAASLPSPYAPGFAGATYVATIVGIGADAVAQLMKPDVGQYWTNSGSAMISDHFSTKYPLASPAINEAANRFNESSLSHSIKEFINYSWDRISNKSAKK